MQVTEEDLKQYMQTHLEVRGRTITKEVAFVELSALLNFMDTVYKSNIKHNGKHS
jgi:hypothetical protein